MKIVTTNGGLDSRFGVDKSIELIADAGFDGVDFNDIPVDTGVWGDSYKEYAMHLKNVAASSGIEFTQTHAPITGSALNYYEGDIQKVTDRVCRSIEFASLLGAENVVVHPIQDPKFATKSEEVFEKNISYFSKLVKCAENYNVKVAIENMVMVTLDGLNKRDGVCADPIEFKRYIDTLNSNNVTCCLDYGHSALSGREPQDMLRAMGGNYITSTHIHDNDFVHDSHQLPCTMKMDWDEICKAMAEIDFKGDFTLEAVCFPARFDDELIPDVLKIMYKTAKHLVEKVERYKRLYTTTI